MPKPVFLVRFFVAGLIALILGSGAAQAQGTPQAASEDRTCTVEPRSLDELVALYFDDMGERREFADFPTAESEAELPGGQPVDALTEAEINAVFSELAACLEREQFARAFALMTDELAFQLAPGVGDMSVETPEEVRAMLQAALVATPAVSGEEFEVSPGRDLHRLADGRVGGVWAVDDDAAFVVFEQADDGWLVAEIIDIVED